MTNERIHIERMSYGSAGIGHLASGKAVFVDGAVPGDYVSVILDENKTSYSKGHIGELLEASPLRIKASCPACKDCGGCPWQILSYEAQLSAKSESVAAALIHTAHFDKARVQSIMRPCIGSKKEFGYRNKLELSTAYENNRFLLGFRKESSHDIISPKSCCLAHEVLSKAPKALHGALSYLQGTRSLDIFRVGVRHSLKTNDLEIALWTPPSSFPRKMVAQTLQSALETTSIVRVLADPGKARSIKGVECLYGKGFWAEKLKGFIYKTSAPSFFQVNTEQAENLIQEVINGLGIQKGGRVADLYAGGGTFSLPFAQRGYDVFAVESASSSIQDLRRNAEANNLDINIIGGDSAREITSLGNLDALIVDPPRSGLPKGMAEKIAAVKPAHIAYVSCDPQTWARDIVRLEKIGYGLVSAQPVDMFPQTYHVEIVSVLARQ